MLRRVEKKLRKPVQKLGEAVGLRDKDHHNKHHHNSAPTAQPETVPQPEQQQVIGSEERLVNEGQAHDATAIIPVVPEPVIPERVVQLENQVLELEGKLANENARADGAVQELKDVKECAERVESLKSTGEKLARAAVSKHLEERGYHAAAERVNPSIPTDTVTVMAIPRNVTESKIVIESAFRGCSNIQELLEDEGYEAEEIALKKVMKLCRANRLRLTDNLIAAGELRFNLPQIEEKLLADQPVPRTQEQPLVEQLAQTIAQLALIEQPEPMTTDGQASSEYLEAQEPNPAMLFAAAQMPLTPFLPQLEIQENAPVQGDTLVQDDVLSVRMRVAGQS